MGYIVTPSLSSATQITGIDPEATLASKNFNFPSVVLYISAAPLVYVPSKDEAQLGKIESDQETDRFPEYLDATFTLTPEDVSGNDLTKSACTDGDVQILGLLPQQTIAGAQNSVLADTASAISNVAGSLTPFYPTVQSQVTSATKALNVLFQDLFPPKPIAYQYSYMDGNCTFGWFFRPNTSTTTTGTTAGQSSILGLQTGIILLKTDKSIKKIVVSGQILSSWNKSVTKNNSRSGGKLYLGKKTELTFPLPDPGSIDYNRITDLSVFPALISKLQAKRILHIPDNDPNDALWTAFVTRAQLVTTSTANDYVTNASLSAFLTSKPSPPPSKP
jgi:hypothetical protein